MNIFISYIYVWQPKVATFDTQESRNKLFMFMDDEEIYCNLVEDLGDVIDLNMVLSNEPFADSIYSHMRPATKDMYMEYLKTGKIKK